MSTSTPIFAHSEGTSKLSLNERDGEYSLIVRDLSSAAVVKLTPAALEELAFNALKALGFNL